MSASDYVHCDDDIATCSTFENEINWREELRDMVLLQGSTLTESDSEDKDDIVELASKITTFTEAIDLRNEMIKYLTERGEEKVMFKIVQQLESAKLQHSKQISITSFSF